MISRIGQRRALVVGINEYEGAGYRLPSCVADARAAAALLRDTYGFADVRELYDGEVSRDSIVTGLAALVASLNPSDRVVFYYSGHGARQVKDGVLRESLVMPDLTMLDDDTFVDATQDAPAGILTVVLDACFSGGLWKEFREWTIKSISFPATEKVFDAAVEYRPFGFAARAMVGPFVAARKAVVVNASALEVQQPTLNGLLIAACRETEPAAASTPATGGLSAFTFALLKAIAALGVHAAAADLVVQATTELRAIGIPQSPQIHEPGVRPEMSARTLFEVDAASANVVMPAHAGAATELVRSPPKSLIQTTASDPLMRIALASARAAATFSQ
jgi:uncharacterized caspase-like protein